MEHTDIQNYYKNKTVFITGGTGLLGKGLVEKLLRSCPELKQIILPIRPIRNASFESRIADYFNDKLFDMIKTAKSEVLMKVIFVNSDITINDCGLNSTDYNYVISCVNIIFHCAATVNFNAPLSDAVASNIKATKNIINMAKNMTQLEAFVHVSTVWSHRIMDYTEEKVHKLSYYDSEFLINLVDNVQESTLRKITPEVLDVWPNTYVLTKNLSEVQIAAEKDNLPVAICRAPAITPVYREPLPGWVSSIQAPTALGIGIATGSMKAIYTDPEYNCHVVPTDLVVNCLIGIAWNTATEKKKEEFKVYNYSCVTNPLVRKRFCDSFLNTKYPLENTIWTPGYRTTNSKWLFDKYIILYHTIPAFICDIFLKIFNQEQKYQNIIKRNNLILYVSGWFFLTDIKLEFQNTPTLWNKLSLKDKQLFNFDVNSINWDEYLDIYTKSAKEQLKEDFSKMDQCKAKRYLKRELQVYNYAPVTNPISRKKYLDSFVYTKFPLDCTVWTPGYIAINSKRLYEIYALLYHTIPGYICDMLLKMQQQKPIFAKIMETNKKMLKTCRDFMILEFKIEYRNIPALWSSLHPDDQQLFNFDLDSVNWDEYMDIFTKSAKYMLNEDFNNMEKAEINRYLLRCKY